MFYQKKCINDKCEEYWYVIEYDRGRWVLKLIQSEKKTPSQGKQIPDHKCTPPQKTVPPSQEPSAPTLPSPIEEIKTELRNAIKSDNDEVNVYGKDIGPDSEDIVRICLLNCNHTIGCDSLSTLLETADTPDICPICRAEITNIEWTKNKITSRLSLPTKPPEHKGDKWVIPSEGRLDLKF